MNRTTPLRTKSGLRIGSLYWPKRSARYATAVVHFTRPSLLRRIFTHRRSLLPQTREGWGRAIGAALGSAGAVYMLWHVARAAGVM